jgi:hypothetical protein
MPQQVDWTLETAPEADEPHSEAPAPQRRPRAQLWLRLGRAGLLLLVIVAGVLAGLGGYRLWTELTIYRQLRHLIAAEEAAASRGDAGALAALADPDDPAWRHTLTQLAQVHQPAPIPSPALHALPGADRIAFTLLATDEVRADVTRDFRAPDGSTLAFTLPQYYRFTHGEWRHSAPPAAGGANGFWIGNNLNISTRAADAGYVANDLGPYLDDVLGQACATWRCPRGPIIGVAIADGFFFDAWPGQPPPPAGAPLLFSFVRLSNPAAPSGSLSLLADSLIIQSPRQAGYPADPASAEWLRRAIAIQLLNRLAEQISRQRPGQPGNALRLALVARMGAQLGLEPPSVLTATHAAPAAPDSPQDPSSSLNLMWNLGLADGRGQPLLGYWEADGAPAGNPNPGTWDALLGHALDLTNWLLRDQPPEIDGTLLSSLAGATDPTSWLARGLGLTPEAAWARLQVGQWQMSSASSRQQFLVNCSYGAGLLASGNSQVTYFLPWETGTFGAAQVTEYSPNGQWAVGDNIAVNLLTGSILTVTAPQGYDTLALRGWVSDTILAYVERLGGLQANVRFYNLADPQKSPPTLDNILDYRLSPDKVYAAILILTGPANNNGAPLPLGLQVIPALGGPPLAIDPASDADLSTFQVAWSPDSRQLAYVHQDPASGNYSLRVAEAASGVSRELISYQALGLVGYANGLFRWSPTGQQIAFTLGPWDSGSSVLGVINADGTGLQVLNRLSGFYTHLDWSADGKFLATTEYESRGQSLQAGTNVVYAAAGGPPVAQLVNSWSFAWAPQGHQMVNLHNPLQLLDEPDTATPQILTTDSCSSVAWKPKP